MQNRNDLVASLVKAIPSKRPAVVVASFGRSGSTLLFEAMSWAMSRVRFGRRSRYTKDEAWDLSSTRLRPGIVYKTHDYPDALTGRDRVRSVFVFGSATDNVLSTLNQEKVKGRRWINAHLKHLRSTGCFEEILQRDVLGIMAQMDAWSTFDSSPILCVRYEALWDVQSDIRDFTGLPIELPKRRQRVTKEVASSTLSKVMEFYGPIDARIAQLPDMYLSGKNMSRLINKECGS